MGTPRMSNNGLRVTPRPSPFRTPTAKSPIKGVATARDEPQCLTLKQVIGTTSSSSNGLDCLPSRKSFAFIAGAAAVVVKIGGDGQLSQRFFRAKPSTSPINTTESIYDSPTPNGNSQLARSKTASSLRESGIGYHNSPHLDSGDSPGANGKVSAARERSKAATCVSFSPDGRLLAVGEIGHRPRVLLFSLTADCPTDIPLTVISEHTFGVRCAAFSPDSQHLATLGDMNDGFLYIWNVNTRNGQASLHANNRCTSSIRQILWMGQNLITLGTRHVKLWRVGANPKSSPSRSMRESTWGFASPSRALAGRNCLLGPLLDKTFTAAATVSAHKAVVCSEDGEICLLDDTEDSTQFYRVASVPFGVSSVTVLSERSIIVAGEKGEMRAFDFQKLHMSSVDELMSSEVTGAMMPFPDVSEHILALRAMDDRLVVLDGLRHIQVLDPSPDASSHGSTVHRLPAHGGAVLGVQALDGVRSPLDACFLTWSAQGSVLFWKSSGACVKDMTVELEQPNVGEDEPQNELKVAEALPDGRYMVTGDKLGVLRLVEISTGESQAVMKAHSAEITDLSVYDDSIMTLIASSGRDRAVQLFERMPAGNTELIQTMEDHVGAVTGVRFSADGSKLVSCSSDRTIAIRDAVSGDLGGRNGRAFLTTRTITLKASPLSIDLTKPGEVLVSAIDRFISRYDIDTGSVIGTFKTSDLDNGDAVIVNPAIYVPTGNGAYHIAGVSGTDKSIRVYEENGRLLARDFGHTENMTRLAVVSSKSESEDSGKKLIVSVATDGTVFLWNFATGMDQLTEMMDSLDVSQGTTRANAFFSARPPLRRVLSSSDLLKFHPVNSPDENGVSPTTPNNISGTLPRQLRKKVSTMSLQQIATPKLNPPPPPPSSTSPPSGRTKRKNSEPEPSRPLRKNSEPEGWISSASQRRISKSRGASPTRTRQLAQTMRVSHRPSMPNLRPSTTSRRQSMTASTPTNTNNDFNSLAVVTDQICRSLHQFRKKLSTSSDMLPLENVRELERELSLTAKELAGKAARHETVMVKLLDQYSERLFGMLDKHIASSMAKQLQPKSGSSGEQSPDDEET